MKIPSKENNQFGVDYAFPGLCSYCHSEIATFKGSQEVLPGVFRPIIHLLKPNYRECTFELNDGSLMQIALCQSCDDDIEPKHMDHLMESEINGWQKEIDELLPKWEESKKSDHMDQHSKKFITGRKTKPWTLGQISKITKPRPEKLKVKVKKGK